MQSQENSARTISTSQIKTSRRKIVLKERNIGSRNPKENSSYRKIKKLKQKELVFKMDKNDVPIQGIEFFNYSKQNKTDQLPVSQRKNDVLKISARAFNNPETLVQMKLFEQEVSKENGIKHRNEVIFEERTDDEQENEPKRKEEILWMEAEKEIEEEGEETVEKRKENDENGSSGEEQNEVPKVKNFTVNLGLFGQMGESEKRSLKRNVDLEKNEELDGEEGNFVGEKFKNLKETNKIKFLEDFSNENGQFLNIKTLENSELIPKENVDFFNEKKLLPPKFDFQKKMFGNLKKKTNKPKKKIIFNLED